MAVSTVRTLDHSLLPRTVDGGRAEWTYIGQFLIAQYWAGLVQPVEDQCRNEVIDIRHPFGPQNTIAALSGGQAKMAYWFGSFHPHMAEEVMLDNKIFLDIAKGYDDNDYLPSKSHV